MSTTPYRIHTTSMCETSSGVYWHAELLLDGTRVGFVEQEGSGGADKVTFQFIADRTAWQAWVAEQFDGNEEHATFHLMSIEDALLLGEVSA